MLVRLNLNYSDSTVLEQWKYTSWCNLVFGMLLNKHFGRDAQPFVSVSELIASYWDSGWCFLGVGLAHVAFCRAPCIFQLCGPGPSQWMQRESDDRLVCVHHQLICICSAFWKLIFNHLSLNLNYGVAYMQARRALTTVMEPGILRAGNKARSRITILDLKWSSSKGSWS